MMIAISRHASQIADTLQRRAGNEVVNCRPSCETLQTNKLLRHFAVWGEYEFDEVDVVLRECVQTRDKPCIGKLWKEEMAF